MGLIPLAPRSKPYLTFIKPARTPSGPRDPLSAAKRRLSHLDLDSDSESDDGQPSPRCRRRKLFPPSRSTSILDIFSPSASWRRGAILLQHLSHYCTAAVLFP